MSVPDKVLLALAEVPGQTATQLAKRLNSHAMYLGQVLLSLLKLHKVSRKKNAEQRYVYELTVSAPTKSTQSGEPPMRMTFDQFALTLHILDVSFPEVFETFKDELKVQEAMAHVCSRLLTSMKHTLVKGKK